MKKDKYLSLVVQGVPKVPIWYCVGKKYIKSTVRYEENDIN